MYSYATPVEEVTTIFEPGPTPPLPPPVEQRTYVYDIDLASSKTKNLRKGTAFVEGSVEVAIGIPPQRSLLQARRPAPEVLGVPLADDPFRIEQVHGAFDGDRALVAVDAAVVTHLEIKGGVAEHAGLRGSP